MPRCCSPRPRRRLRSGPAAGRRCAIRAPSTKYAANSKSRLTVSGPGAFSVEIGGRTAREASWIGTIDSLIFALLLWLAYRSWKAPLLGALPLASGGLAGLAAVTLCFDGVHGITVAFGFTLIGVAQDYPIHLFSAPARRPVALGDSARRCGRRSAPAWRRPASPT